MEFRKIPDVFNKLSVVQLKVSSDTDVGADATLDFEDLDGESRRVYTPEEDTYITKIIGEHFPGRPPTDETGAWEALGMVSLTDSQAEERRFGPRGIIHFNQMHFFTLFNAEITAVNLEDIQVRDYFDGGGRGILLEGDEDPIYLVGNVHNLCPVTTLDYAYLAYVYTLQKG